MKILSKYYRRFNVDESCALAVVAIACIASLACEWFSALFVLSRAESGGLEVLIQAFLLTIGAVLSVVLWRKSRAGVNRCAMCCCRLRRN